MTPRGELQAREGLDGDGIRSDVVNVAERDVGLAGREEPAETVAEAGQVAPRDRPVDGECDRARRFKGHRSIDRLRCDNSSAGGR